MSSSSTSPEVNGDVTAAILGHAARVPARDALVFADPSGPGWRRLTYADLAARVRRTAAGLAARGVGKGARVVVLVPVSPDLYVVLLAVASLGAVAVLVEPAATPAEMARAIRVTRPVAFVGVPKAHALRFLDRDVSRVPLAVVVGSPRAARALQGVALTDLEQPEAASRVVRSPDDPILVTFSSGTPQGAVRSGELLAAQHAAMARLLGADEHGETPYVHVSAFAIVLLSTLISGGTAVIPPLRIGVDDSDVDRIVDADRIVDVIRDRGVTTISGSPAFLAPIVEAAARRTTGAAGPHPLASLRRILTGGAPAPVDLCERALRVLPATCQLIVAYGSPEAEPIATVDGRMVAAAAAAIRRGDGLLAGTVWPGLRLTLVRPSAAPIVIGAGGLAALEVTPGVVGEVVVAGDRVNETYLRDGAAERASEIVDEIGTIWHRTGDTARLDAAGRLWLVGRVADMVRRGDAASQAAAVEVVGRAQPWGERAALVEDGTAGAPLVVEPRAGVARLSARARSGEAVRHLAAHGVAVDEVRVAPQLPVDPRHRATLDCPKVRRRFA
jgi:acyl-CoA synthetase (AMP-forming)/AMP-acid ligase II